MKEKQARHYLYPQASIYNGVFQFDIPVIIDNDVYDFPGISFSAYSDDASKLIYLERS